MHARALPAVTVLSIAGFAVGCASSGDGPERSVSRRVTPTDFRGEVVASAASPDQGLEPAPLTFDEPVSRSEARGGVGDDVITITGSPSRAPLQPAAVGEGGSGNGEVMLDRIVGRVNGKPVLASEFLEPLDARLRAEAQDVLDAPNARARSRARDKWVADARDRIDIEVWEIVRDELLLSEFRSSINEQQQQGVRYFLEQLREQRFLELGGTEKTVESNLLSEGMTFDEYIQALGDRQIRLEQLNRIIARQATVSRRDVEVYYEMNIDDFTKQAGADLRILQIPLDEEGDIAEAERRLAAGEPFSEVALDLSRWRPPNADRAPEDSNQLNKPLPDEAFTEAVFFNRQDEMNEAIRALSEGETTRRIDALGSAYWVRLDRLQSAEVVPLYDAQFEIESRIGEQRRIEAVNAYFRSLLEKSSTTDPRAMILELTAFAEDRYLPPLDAGGEGSP